jgi:hypothetical protein
MFFTLEITESNYYSFPKGTQFSCGNNVHDPPASNVDCFLTRDTVLLPFPRMELFFHKGNVPKA